jgi:hypothetical protein
MFTESSMKPCPKLLTLIILFISSGYTQSQREQVIGHIYEMKTYHVSIAESKRRLLLQKLHTIQPQFNGFGFFIINYSTLIGVIYFPFSNNVFPRFSQ